MEFFDIPVAPILGAVTPEDVTALLAKILKGTVVTVPWWGGQDITLIQTDSALQPHVDPGMLSQLIWRYGIGGAVFFMSDPVLVARLRAYQP
jgi:hypothetical protein